MRERDPDLFRATTPDHLRGDISEISVADRENEDDDDEDLSPGKRHSLANQL
jgi:hypothetical protein